MAIPKQDRIGRSSVDISGDRNPGVYQRSGHNISLGHGTNFWSQVKLVVILLGPVIELMLGLALLAITSSILH